MLETKNIDIFSIANGPNTAICITTNGMIKKDGRAVMGKGIAKVADNYFNISGLLGIYLSKYGNRAFDMGLYSFNGCNPYHVLTFPTKHDWRNDSDINLIKTSAEQIDRICKARGIDKCFLPPVGCANGHLNYDDVRQILMPILDDRYIIITEYKH